MLSVVDPPHLRFTTKGNVGHVPVLETTWNIRLWANSTISYCSRPLDPESASSALINIGIVSFNRTSEPIGAASLMTPL